MNGTAIHLEIGDLVITPSGEAAEIEGFYDERVQLRYKNALNKSSQSAYVALKPQLLRRIEQGKPTPAPVRILLKDPA